METIGDIMSMFSTPHNHSPQSNDYEFFDVILCVKKTNKSDTFICHKFNTFSEADKYFHTNYLNKEEVINSTMIPICKFMPNFLEKQVIQYKVSKIFNKIDLN